MDLRVLGPVELWLHGKPVALGPRRQRFVLAALALAANRAVPVDRLVELTWSESPPRTAVHALQVYVSGLRTALGDSGITLARRGTGYVLHAETSVIDAHRFRDLLERARRAPDDQARVGLLTAALAEWRGVPLDDAATDDARLRLCRDLEEARLSAEEDRADALLRLGRHAEAAGELTGLIDAHPLRERLAGQLMLALCRGGQKAEALAVYRRLRDGLADELGLDPSGALRQLELAILRDDPDIAPPAPAPPSPAPPRLAPAQLPPNVIGFTGRATELRRLDTLLDDGSQLPIGVLSGSPGIGKTALAVHWAHRVADRFPDGQLYVNLRGFGPGDTPVNPLDVLRGFLGALDVPSARTPVDEAGRAALYRSLVAGRRLLIVLDNARDADQVRPLLPGSVGCAVLVTSRNRLVGLVAAEGAYPIQLRPLPSAEAHALLARRLGTARVAAAEKATAEIIGRCASIPLALAIVAARGATQPDLPLDALADELGEERTTLDALNAGDGPATDIRAVFSWSYRLLSDGAAAVFRLLGIMPGPEVGTAAAASLAGLSPGELRPLLTELLRSHLVAEPAPGRFTCHDLLRAYAAELAAEVDSAEDHRAASRRAVDHYLHTAFAAHAAFAPRSGANAGEPPPPAPGVRAETFADRPQAMAAWFVAERATLPAVIELAAATGLDEHASQLATVTSTVLHRLGHFSELISVQQTALAAATRLGDPSAQGTAHSVLARAYLSIGDLERSYAAAAQALRLFRLLKDAAGLGRTHRHLSALRTAQGQRREAVEHLRRAERYFRLAGDAAGEAVSVNNIGYLLAEDGEYDEGLLHCRRAAEILQRVGFRHGEAAALDSIGFIHLRRERPDDAIPAFRAALALMADPGADIDRAQVLEHLGDAEHAVSDPASARTSWQQAVDILDQAGHPDAERVRAKLRALPS